MVAQQRSRFGSPQALAAPRFSIRQQPIQRRGADLPDELPLRRQQLAVVPLIVRHPQRQRFDQALAAQLLGRRPHPLYHLQHRSILGLRPGRRALEVGWPYRTTQKLNGILALIAVVLTEFIQQTALALQTSPLITP